jgi:hypothetical protein
MTFDVILRSVATKNLFFSLAGTRSAPRKADPSLRLRMTPKENYPAAQGVHWTMKL